MDMMNVWKITYTLTLQRTPVGNFVFVVNDRHILGLYLYCDFRTAYFPLNTESHTSSFQTITFFFSERLGVFTRPYTSYAMSRALQNVACMIYVLADSN